MEHTTLDVNREGLMCVAFQDKWSFFLDYFWHQCFIWSQKYHIKIQLPPIPDFKYFVKTKLLKCILIPSITHNTQSLHTDHKKRRNKNPRLNGYLCTVFVFLKRELCFLVCRPPLYAQWEAIEFARNWTSGLCNAVEFLNGKCIYTICMNGKLGIIEDGPKITMTAPYLLSTVPTDKIAMYKRRQLVSYQNQLLLVQQKLGSPSVIEVWNVDLTTKQFSRMFDLNGMYIFLSRGYSSAIYAPDQGNCVYFTEDDHDHCISKREELHAFDFKDQSIFVSPQENICIHNAYNSVPSLMPGMFKTQQNAGDDDLKDKSDELNQVNWRNTKEQIVQPNNNNICDLLPLDLQVEISRYLLIQDAQSYMNFRSVSKLWKSLAPRMCWKVDVNSTHSSGSSLQDCVWLLSINQEDGLCTLYNPFTNLTCFMNNNELAGCEIRYSKDGVLLVSRGPRSLFFVEPFSKRIIQLPDRTEDYCCDTMSFSASPFDSPNWIIIGIVSLDKYRVRISYLRAGDDIWTSMIMNNEGIPFLLSCSSPVYSGHEFFVICQNGNVGVFGFLLGVHANWQIKQIAHLYKPCLPSVVCRNFLVKCDEQNLLYSVIVGGQTREHVRVYQLNVVQNTVKLVKEFKTWLIFISEASSFFMHSTKLAGFDDAHLFPKFNSNGDYIHYSLKDGRFKAGKEKCDNICSRKELLGRVWIHNKYLVPHALYEN
ncbi:hypothetical protein KY284_003194 [Solanum tuberosum]|nr:hypothetical protein KY284_003194 [Solanum tuberosum]